MKTLYLECNMGAAGDMLMAALSELLPDPDAFTAKLNALEIPGVEVEKKTVQKCGITGTHMEVTVNGEEEESLDEPHHVHEHCHEHTHEHSHEHDHGHSHEHDHSHGEAEHVHEHEHSHEHTHEHCHDHSHEHEHDHSHGEAEHVHEHSHGEAEHVHEHTHEHTHAHGHHHHHSGMKDIEKIVFGLDVPEKVKEDAMAVYKLIANAESLVHGKTVEEVHFHEVGAMDAVADIVGVCLAMYEIAPDRVMASPVHVGHGQVRCAHGILPVPAPATAHILEGIPIYGGRIEGELCTPTGAALLKHFADSFGPMPVMSVQKTGYGMGKKEFTDANCLRAILGESFDGQDASEPIGENRKRENVDCSMKEMDSILELCCNLDDMTPEKIGYVTELLMEEGAIDVYTTNIQMKKNRPAVLLTCMCRKEEREKFLRLILKHTTTLGVREYNCRRYGLSREIKTVHTEYGDVRVKVASGYGIRKEKAEYDDMARIAKEQGISLSEVEKIVYGKLN